MKGCLKFVLSESLLLQPRSAFVMGNVFCLAFSSCDELWLVCSAFQKFIMNNQFCRNKQHTQQHTKRAVFVEWIISLRNKKAVTVLPGKSGLGSDCEHKIRWLLLALLPTQVATLQL